MTYEKIKEECGICGVFSYNKENTVDATYYGLYALQHRGEESAGIAISNGKRLINIKSMGLVCNLIDKEEVTSYTGILSIGHVRYSTTGDSSIFNAQPIVCNSIIGEIALAHNGNIINGEMLKQLLNNEDFKGSTDSEIILKLIVKNINQGNDLVSSIKKVLQCVEGAYSLLIMTKDVLIAIRDKKGIRPLCIGKISNDKVVVCSESCVLNALDGVVVRELKPGELVYIDKCGTKSYEIFEYTSKNICAFEYVYFAREDSVIEGKSIFSTRDRLGRQLFREDKSVLGDIVMGVPQSGIIAAMAYARESGIPYTIGFTKNRYIGRTFINPNHSKRQDDISVKLNVIEENIRGKKVIVIDDSLVRGNVSKRIVSMLRKAGALEVHFKVACPEIKYCCSLGVNIKNKEELVAYNKNLQQIKEYIGADSLTFLTMNGFKTVLGQQELCIGCFTGKYPYKIEDVNIKNKCKC